MKINWQPENYINELMAKRAKIIEIEAQTKIDKNTVNNDIKQYLIEENMLDFLNVNFESLNRMTKTEPDKAIKRRIHGGIPR